MEAYNRRRFILNITAAIGASAFTPIVHASSSARVTVPFTPAYVQLHRSGELAKRAQTLTQMLGKCSLCPRECGVNRLNNERGICGSTSTLRISSFNPHYGEERPLVGDKGSGTIFFSNCSLLCVFCINWQISHGGEGRNSSPAELARMMLTLQQIGCHNINVVTPTHYSPQIVEALDLAASQGLNLPVAYNTCGWEKLEILKLLDGVVDIYLADYKYFNSTMASKYSAGAASYPQITQDALVEMNRQVGVAKPNTQGIINRGLIIRHLVMPNNVGGSADIMEWIGSNLPKSTYVNIMSQYRPMHKAHNYPSIARRITKEEYNKALNAARKAGLTNLDIQG
jgi:putative pyruvate formate lyase activating enzyme